MHQIKHGRKFIIENPRDSSLWYVHCFQDLLRMSGVTYGNLEFCAFGMRDPETNGYYNKPTSLMHNFPANVLDPLWKTCPNKNNSKTQHKHEMVEGSKKCKFSQVYPYKFCTTLADLIRLFLGKKSRDGDTLLVNDILAASLSDSDLFSVKNHLEDSLYEEYNAESYIVTQPGETHDVLISASLTPMPVKDYSIHQFMVLVNKLSKQAEILLHTADCTPLNNKLYDLAGKLRQKYLPLLWFSKCSVLRGTLGATAPVGKVGEESYLFLWRKNSPPKWIYCLRVQQHSEVLARFDPSRWSCVHFWKDGPSGKSPAVDPPPGLASPPTFQSPLDVPLRDLGRRPTLVLDTEAPSGHHLFPPPRADETGVPQAAPRTHELGGEALPQTRPDEQDHHRDAPPAKASRSRPRARHKDRERSPRRDEPARPSATKENPNPREDSDTEFVPDTGQRERSRSRDPPQNPPQNSSDEELIPESEYQRGFKRRHQPDPDELGNLVIDHSDQTFLTDEQRFAGEAGSFQFCTDLEGNPIDIDEVETPQSTLRALYSDHRGSRYYPDQSLLTELPDPNDTSGRLGTTQEVDDEIRLIEFCFRAQSIKTPSTAKIKKSKEASQTELRQYSKQFAEAKKNEIDSWVENDVYDLVDIRKLSPHDKRNFVTGRWVLNIKRGRDGTFEKCKARWVLRGFQDKQKFDQQTDSPAASRPGFRMACQLASNKSWNLFHMDLKTAFLQGQKYDNTRNIICALPKEAGHPPYMAARMKKPAYGLNDAPRRWFNVVDGSLRHYGCEPTRGDRCTYVMYSQSVYKQTSSSDKDLCIASSPQGGVLEKLLDPFNGNKAKGRQPCGIICLHVDDLFMAGNEEFEKRVLARLRQDYVVGSEDKNDIKFVGQRIRWVTNDKGAASAAHIEVSQQLAVDDLYEIKFDKSLKDSVACTPFLHTEYRSVLGMINWLQSRTQYQTCYKFSRAASQQAAPSIADVRAVNKLVRAIKASPVSLRYWHLRGPCRIVGMPDASYKNNEDKSSQRALTIFLAEARGNGHSTDSRGSLVDYESHKITQTTMSTTVAELYALMKCFGNCLFLKGLWADVSGENAQLHLRTDANNLVTTARTTHQPEQKETIHLIQMLRQESNSGAIDDLAHVVSKFCLSDSLTKHSAKSDELVRAVETGVIRGVDAHPPFRSLIKHKAYLAIWLANNITCSKPQQIHSFMMEPIMAEIYHVIASNS